MGFKSNPRRTAAALFGATLLASSNAFGTTVSWASAISGTWSNSARWSPSIVPNGAQYDVIIGATGSAYNVTFFQDVTLNTLLIDSPNVTFDHYKNDTQPPLGPGILNVGTLNVNRGTYTINTNGLLRNAVVQTGVDGRFTAIYGQLENVKFAGNAQLQAPVIRNGLTLMNATISAVRPSSASFETGLTFDGTQTLGGAGTYSFDGPTGQYIPLRTTNGTLTIGSGVTMRTGTNDGFIGGQFYPFSGTPLEYPDNWVNQGTILSGTPGRTMWLLGNWRNDGVLKVEGGQLALAGQFKSSGIGQIVRNGGTLAISGRMDNTNSVFETNASTGTITTISVGGLPSPRITGGIIRSSPDYPLIGGSSARFQDVTVEGTLVSQGMFARGLNVSAGSKVTVQGQLWIGFGDIPNDNQTVTGGGVIDLQGGTILDYNTPVTLDSNLTVTGSGGIDLDNGFTNRATILANGNGITVNWFGTLFNNTGRLIARNNGFVQLSGEVPVGGLSDWDADGGTIRVARMLRNEGQLLKLDSTHHVLTLGGGGTAATISGGSINSSNGGYLAVTGWSTLSNVDVLDADVVVSGGNSGNPFSIQGPGTTITAGHSIRLVGDQRSFSFTRLDGPGEVRFENTSGAFNQEFIGSVIGPQLVVRTVNGGASLMRSANVPTTLRNEGLISAESPGKQIHVTIGTNNRLDNAGTLRVSAGTFMGEAAINNTGTIDVQGGHFFLGNGWVNNGTINLTGGSLSISGTFARSALGSFNHSGGIASVRGTLNNQNATLSISAATPWQIESGGRIYDGTVKSIDGMPLLATGSATLERATLLSDVRITDGRLAMLDVPAFSGRTMQVVSSGVGTLGAQLQIPWTGTFDGNIVELQGPTGSPGAFVPLPGAAPATAVLNLGSNSVVRTGNGAGQLGTTANSLSNQGLVSARSNQRLDVLARNLDNLGTFEAIDGGTLRVDVSNIAGFANRVGGSVVGSSVFNATLHHGTWIATNGGDIELLRTTIAKNAANVILSGPSTLFPALAPLNENTGRLEMLDGFDFASTGSFGNSGFLRIGDGSDLNVTGALNLSPASQLEFVLAGTGPEQFGQVTSLEQIALGGTLNVTLEPGSALHQNETFLIMAAPSIGGSFSSISLPTAPPGAQVELLVTSTTVSVHVTPEPGAILTLWMFSAGVLGRPRRRRRRR